VAGGKVAASRATGKAVCPGLGGVRHNSSPVGPEGGGGRDWSWADTIEVGSDGAAARVLVCAWGVETGGG
jgi:hypothetical protein